MPVQSEDRYVPENHERIHDDPDNENVEQDDIESWRRKSRHVLESQLRDHSPPKNVHTTFARRQLNKRKHNLRVRIAFLEKYRNQQPTLNEPAGVMHTTPEQIQNSNEEAINRLRKQLAMLETHEIWKCRDPCNERVLMVEAVPDHAQVAHGLVSHLDLQHSTDDQISPQLASKIIPVLQEMALVDALAWQQVIRFAMFNVLKQHKKEISSALTKTFQSMAEQNELYSWRNTVLNPLDPENLFKHAAVHSGHPVYWRDELEYKIALNPKDETLCFRSMAEKIRTGDWSDPRKEKIVKLIISRLGNQACLRDVFLAQPNDWATTAYFTEIVPLLLCDFMDLRSSRQSSSKSYAQITRDVMPMIRQRGFDTPSIARKRVTEIILAHSTGYRGPVTPDHTRTLDAEQRKIERIACRIYHAMVFHIWTNTCNIAYRSLMHAGIAKEVKLDDAREREKYKVINKFKRKLCSFLTMEFDLHARRFDMIARGHSFQHNNIFMVSIENLLQMQCEACNALHISSDQFRLLLYILRLGKRPLVRTLIKQLHADAFTNKILSRHPAAPSTSSDTSAAPLPLAPRIHITRTDQEWPHTMQGAAWKMICRVDEDIYVPDVFVYRNQEGSKGWVTCVNEYMDKFEKWADMHRRVKDMYRNMYSKKELASANKPHTQTWPFHKDPLFIDINEILSREQILSYMPSYNEEENVYELNEEFYHSVGQGIYHYLSKHVNRVRPSFQAEDEPEPAQKQEPATLDWKRVVLLWPQGPNKVPGSSVHFKASVLCLQPSNIYDMIHVNPTHRIPTKHFVSTEYTANILTLVLHSCLRAMNGTQPLKDLIEYLRLSWNIEIASNVTEDSLDQITVDFEYDRSLNQDILLYASKQTPCRFFVMN